MVKSFLLAAALGLGAVCAAQQPIECTTGPRVNPGLYGFNTGISFYHCTPDNFELCLESFHRLRPAVLRFPGGAEANRYHLDGPGYGFRTPPGSTPEGTARRQAGDVYLQRDRDYPNGENVIGTFARLAAADQTPVLFVCNMFDASYGENKAALDSLLRSQVAVAGVELGNEYYLAQYDSVFPDPAAYLLRARDYAGRLRAEYPGLKIGAVAAPAEVRGVDPGRLPYLQSWNAALAQETFYDAIIVHHYGRDRSCLWDTTAALTDSVLSQAFACAGAALDAELDHWFGTALPAYRDQFPGKKLWLTEWNAVNNFPFFGNTQLYNFYFARYLNELALGYGDWVEYALHHNWLGGGRHFPAVRWDRQEQRFVERSSFRVFELLQSLFYRQTYPLQTALAWLAPADVDHYLYFQPADGGQGAALLAVFVNTGDQSLAVAPAAAYRIGGIDYRADWSNAAVRTLYAGHPAASLGAPGFQAEPVAALVPEESVWAAPTLLRPYSVSIVRVALVQ